MDSTCEYYYECLCHKARSTCAQLLAKFGGRTVNCNDYDCATCNCYKEISLNEDTND